MAHVYKKFKSPVGVLTLVAGDDALVAVLWQDDDPQRVRLGALQENAEHSVLQEAERQLQAYFAGQKRAFSLPLNPAGTAFQQQVWKALQAIPYGQKRSYAQIATQINRPKAARAVGAASGRNPLSIIIPCHRVVGANGKLTGFAGGLEVKAHLLDFESKRA